MCAIVTPASSCTLTLIPYLIPWETFPKNDHSNIILPRGQNLIATFQDLTAAVNLQHCLFFLVACHAPFWCSGANLQQYGPVFLQSKDCCCISTMKTNSCDKSIACKGVFLIEEFKKRTKLACLSWN